MSSKTSKLIVLVVFCMVFLFPKQCISLIISEHGNRPIEDRGWPVGCVEMVNLSSRLGWWEGPPFGGGQYQFLYRCQYTSEFNEALKTFAAIRTDRLELVVHNGPEYSFWLKQNDEELLKAENRVDWTLTVWVREKWDSLYNNPKSLFLSDQPNFRKAVAAPRIDIYIGSGSIVWEDVKVPKNVVVIDKRPSSVAPEFAGYGLIQGKVFDMATRRPISGAEIILTKCQDTNSGKETIHGKTNEKGLCQIAKIPLGYYKVTIKAKGFVAQKLSQYNNKRPEYHKFEVGLARPSFLKGIITDLAGNPIEGVKVSARNIIGTDGFGYPCLDDKSATSDKQGRFEIRNLPMGSANTHCDAESLHMTNSIFEVYTMGSDSIKLTMTGTATIHGKVVDRNGKRPSGQIVLEIKPVGENQLGKWGYSGYLSEDGILNISSIPPGRYTISTRPNPSNADYEPNTKEITVEAGKVYKIEITHK